MKSALDRIAFFRGRRDERPNQELARRLARAKDRAGIREIAANLRHPNRNVQSDCLKVLYEIGYLEPGLIAPYADDFLDLLGSSNNRLVWGSMIALATISPLKAAPIGKRVDEVIQSVEKGSLITVVWGVRTLSRVAAAQRRYRSKILPHLMRQLKTCLPRDVPMHAESMLPAITAADRRGFLAVLARRAPNLSPAQAARLRRVLRSFEASNEGKRSGSGEK